MATPVNDNYVGESGVTLYAGRSKPLPLWARNKNVNEWFTISNTSGAGGAVVNAYSGFALTPNGVLVSACSGGHSDSSDNRVTSIDLMSDVPSWTLRSAKSDSASIDLAYNADGKPSSRHVYHQNHYIPQFDRIMMFGLRFTYPNAHTFLTVDGFDLNSNTWSSQGTYADIPLMNGGGIVDRDGNYWFVGCQRKATFSGVNTITYSQPLTQTAANSVRYPWALDTTRNQFFGLCFGDGEGAGNSQVNAVKQSGNVQTQITFNASSALTQFINDAPAYAGMSYDPINDFFLFYSGAVAGRLYKIIPNNTSVWDMEIFNYGAGSVTPVTAAGSGVLSRFHYVKNLKGFVMMPNSSNNLYFMRTA